jgi:adenine-specific DNA-methyltransferase
LFFVLFAVSFPERMAFVELDTQTSQINDDITGKSVVELVDLHRIRVGLSLDPERKAKLGQFLTPSPVAKFMASLFQHKEYRNIRLLDAGAGIGSLIAAFT